MDLRCTNIKRINMKVVFYSIYLPCNSPDKIRPNYSVSPETRKANRKEQWCFNVYPNSIQARARNKHEKNTTTMNIKQPQPQSQLTLAMHAQAPRTRKTRAVSNKSKRANNNRPSDKTDWRILIGGYRFRL